jgi:hypothetical protein
MAYQKRITAAKAIEAPAIIIGVSKLINIVLKNQGIDIDENIIYPIVISCYGTAQGLINYIKNRKRR